MIAFVGKFVRRPLTRGALLLALTAFSGCSSPANPQAGRRGASVSTVSTAAELQAAMKRARAGDVIELRPGHYPAFSLRGIKTGGNAIIRSADARQPASIGGMVLRDIAGFTFRDLTIEGPANGQRYKILLLGSHSIAFERLRLRGYNAQQDPAVVAAVMLRDSRDIRFAGSHFSYFQHGLAMLDVANLTVENNAFEKLQTDGVRGGGVSGLTVTGNLFTDFHPAQGDHPDGIQLWSTHQTTAGRKIVIRDNLVFRGTGSPTQGIFIRDTFEKLPFEDVIISGNLVIGSLYNGIAVNGVKGAVIADNEVIASEDRKSWIRVNHGSSVELRNNRAMHFVLRDNPGPIREDGNRVTSPSDRAWGQRIAAWAQSRPTFAQAHARMLPALESR